MTETRFLEMSSAGSEDLFRRIFMAHLKAEGHSAPEAHEMIFRTPPRFHQSPSSEHGLELLAAFSRHYQSQLAYGWYFEGLDQSSQDEDGKPGDMSLDCVSLEPPAKPVTFIVFPGLFGEFNAQLPFQEIVDQPRSRFADAWSEPLRGGQDEFYDLLTDTAVPCNLSELVEIGSLDQDDRSFLNVIVLPSRGGSLETLDTLESNAEVFQRRLERLFEIIDIDTDIYLVGYSRGFAVALELASRLHAQSKDGDLPGASRCWFERLRGVLSLGGVCYGAAFARDVLSGEAGATSELLTQLLDTARDLETVPDEAKARDRAAVLAVNAKVWSRLVKRLSDTKDLKAAAGLSFLNHDLLDVYLREAAYRVRTLKLPTPNPWGIFHVVNSFLLKTFRLQDFVTRYNDNILAFKRLVAAVVTAVQTLTPESRDAWWRNRELPGDLVLLSVTGTMPDAHMNDFYSPLWRFSGFGAHTSDYNALLRSNYYTTLASENTQINDAQVSHYSSRYWREMYPEHHYTHYYLGVLGTHHWGMAFPYMFEDDAKIGANPFPRTTLLRSIAAFIEVVSGSAGDRSSSH